ncbi:MAG: hypothetical protein ACM3X4_05705 [Ignavibacteriales bacterium]
MKRSPRRKPFIVEGPVWRHFGYGEGQERDCASCDAEFATTGRAPAATRDCWKLELWLGQLPDPDWLVSMVLSEAARDRSLVGKYSVHPLPAGAQGEFDRVMFLYFKSREQMEAFSEHLVAAMEKHGKLPSAGWRPPFRKGCWHFEPVAGPWQTWDE